MLDYDVDCSTVNSEEDLVDEGTALSFGSEGTDTETCIRNPITGTLTLTEACCHARYRSKTALSDNKRLYICIHKYTCRKREGGYHGALQSNHRAEPGIYEGVFHKNGKPIAALAGSWATESDHAGYAKTARATNRMQAEVLLNLSSTTKSIHHHKSSKSSAIPPTKTPSSNATLAALVSKLCDKLDNIQASTERQNMAILQIIGGIPRRYAPNSFPSILSGRKHSPSPPRSKSPNDTMMLISLVAERYVAYRAGMSSDDARCTGDALSSGLEYPSADQYSHQTSSRATRKKHRSGRTKRTKVRIAVAPIYAIAKREKRVLGHGSFHSFVGRHRADCARLLEGAVPSSKNG